MIVYFNYYFSARAIVCALAISVMAPSKINAESLVSIHREEVVEVLQGREDFEELTAGPFPGVLYRTRIAFAGIVASTRFVGQISIIRNSPFGTYGENAGAPVTDLKEWARDSRYSSLHALEMGSDIRSHGLTSAVFIPGEPRSGDEVGFGAVVLKFSNRQFAFGFDLLPLLNETQKTPHVVMRSYGEDGTEVAEPVVLTEFRRYTWTTRDLSRIVKGIEFVNPGSVGFAIDEIVFELPLRLGACWRCSERSSDYPQLP